MARQRPNIIGRDYALIAPSRGVWVQHRCNVRCNVFAYVAPFTIPVFIGVSGTWGATCSTFYEKGDALYAETKTAARRRYNSDLRMQAMDWSIK